MYCAYYWPDNFCRAGKITSVIVNGQYQRLAVNYLTIINLLFHECKFYSNHECRSIHTTVQIAQVSLSTLAQD